MISIWCVMDAPGLSPPTEHAPPVNNVEHQEQDGKDAEECQVCPTEALGVLPSSARTCLEDKSNVDNVIFRYLILIVEI